MTEIAKKIKEETENYKRNFATSLCPTKLIIEKDEVVSNRTIIDSCEECSKKHVCKYIESFKSYATSIKRYCSEYEGPIQAVIKCPERLQLILTRTDEYGKTVKMPLNKRGLND